MEEDTHCFHRIGLFFIFVWKQFNHDVCYSLSINNSKDFLHSNCFSLGVFTSSKIVKTMINEFLNVAADEYCWEDVWIRSSTISKIIKNCSKEESVKLIVGVRFSRLVSESVEYLSSKSLDFIVDLSFCFSIVFFSIVKYESFKS